jgi:hypothetical protein
LGYDKSNDQVRTPKINAIFGSIPILSKEISNIKKGEPIPVHQFSDCVTSADYIMILTKLRFENPTNKKDYPVILTKLRFENPTNKKTLKQAWRFFF